MLKLKETWLSSPPLVKVLAIVLSLAWVVVLVASAVDIHEYKDSLWPHSNSIWYPVMLLLPLLGTAVFLVIFCRRNALDAQKHFVVIGLLVMSGLLAMSFLPERYSGLDDPNLLGVFVPLFLQGIVVYLCIGWMKHLRGGSPSLQSEEMTP